MKLGVAAVCVGDESLPRHRHDEFVKFLDTINTEVPRGLSVHLILDNYATHKHPEVQKWGSPRIVEGLTRGSETFMG